MPMAHSRFGALILTHGRPDRVYTYDSLRKSGYTGPIVIVVDDEDDRVDDYRARFGDDAVEVFDKRAVAARIDEADNFDDRRAIVYARNASFEIARARGFETFIQLDDDYVDFRHKRNERGEYIHRRDIYDLDAIFDALLDYFLSVPSLSCLAMAQGGDFVGGANGTWARPGGVARRKAMNTLICSVDRPIEFRGRINEDVTTYVLSGSRGALFLTTPYLAIQQKQTQATDGGMSELYRERGTYVKTFYSVMHSPSSVRVSILGFYPRIHHFISWRNAVPMILSESRRAA